MDTQGRLARAQQVPGLATIAVERDERGRIRNLSQSDGAETRALTFGHGPDGFLQTVTDPLDRTANYERDPVGRVTQKTETIQGVATTYAYAYDLGGVWSR